MITLYRCISSQDETMLTFQATDEDLHVLKHILRFEPKQSNLPSLYEKGYYAYIRGQWRDKTEREALAYLTTHFTPPKVDVLLFSNDRKLPADRPFSEWTTSLEWAIHHHFIEQGFLVAQGGLGHEIYRKQPRQIYPDLEAFEGVTYRIHVAHDYTAKLQVDISYRLHYKSQYIRERDLGLHIMDDLPVVLARLKDFTTRDTDTIFKLAQQFVKSIPSLPVGDGYSFDFHPLTAETLNFNTWLWEHDAPVRIQVGSQATVPAAQHISKYHYGLYTAPSDPLVVIVVYPGQNVKKWCSFQDWATVHGLVRQNLDSILGKANNVMILLQEYSVSEDVGEVITACEAQLSGLGKHIPIFLIITPPENSRSSSDSELVALNNFTYHLGRNLRNICRGAYTSTISWLGLENPYDRQYVIESALLKSIVVMGAIPWRITDLVHNPNEQREDVCFIGIDVNIYKRVPLVGGVIFDSYGVLQGYHLVRLAKPDGDKIDGPAFCELIDNLVRHYRRATGRKPKHVIIHRDGLIGDEQQIVADFSAQSGIDIDLVEVRKSGSPRLRQEGNINGTPSRDIAIGSEQDGVAYLVNTLTTSEQLTTKSYVFPAPDSITIKRKQGTTPMKILAAQAHALSHANYTAYRRTTRLPITITYADALVNNASLKLDQSTFGKSITPGIHLYWL